MGRCRIDGKRPQKVRNQYGSISQTMPKLSIPFLAKYGLYTVLGYVREPTKAQKTYQQYP
jgi:hypothetical protein